MTSLANRLGGRVRFGEPMNRYTTWGVGGPAWAMCSVADASEAAFVGTATAWARMDCMALGRGSNVLVHDGGYHGVMLRLTGELASLKRQGDGLKAGGGASLNAAVKLAASVGLSGLEWAIGIPGTIGGAVAMNAGAHGADMSELLLEVELLNVSSEVQTMVGADLPSAYRSGGLPRGSLVLSVRLALTPDDPKQIAQRQADFLAKRRKTQPLSARTAGSVFRNPPGDFAGRLIEAAGCKGLTKGGAQVSQVHANFIENQGSATAEDILALMDEVAARVLDQFGVRLEREVLVVGNA